MEEFVQGKVDKVVIEAYEEAVRKGYNFSNWNTDELTEYLLDYGNSRVYWLARNYGRQYVANACKRILNRE